MADDHESSSDESLDARSENFDPLKALYSKKTKILSVKAPVYDNIVKFESVIAGCAAKKKSGQIEGEPMQRKFLPNQGMIQGSSRSRERFIGGRNILTKMKKAYGPLGELYVYMENKIKVKVYTRNAEGIRGFIEAYVVAFDKHWNLALEDCFEVWTRKKKRKAPALGSANEEVEKDESVPKVIVQKTTKKTETLERHVPQLLVRGEQVAIIVKLN
ncbi:U7 snRNA-associated Sm-like protein LSm11 [Leptopilina heterotoma]|uniref:U7 snRNA-associated Sm-like protein LSm11 n=1 Tax=Leptopilina heterotoma TaxID=63436 RepID=UPI001CA7E33A|nr:U7 snRNA-associated Sm-like protein LSm11 [Leptopilina heterotoma]